MKIAVSAALINVALVCGALIQGDAALATGIAVCGAVVLVNFGLWVLAVQRLFNAVLSGTKGVGATFLISTKMVAIGLLTWGSTQLFPAQAVVAGSSVIVLAILLHAAVLGAANLVAPKEA
ncbi:MAG: hypothetical protein GXP62_15830 [Oligoflexia bacterium]|nr:hypothetical protein [Oligoflexia bacterium]